MLDEEGFEKFARWRADPRPSSFAARVLAAWLKARTGCQSTVVEDALRDLPKESGLGELIDVVEARTAEQPNRRTGRRPRKPSLPR